MKLSANNHTTTPPFKRQRILVPAFCVAFTLIELLVVIAIIGLLASLSFPVLAIIKQRAKINLAKQEMKKLEAAITHYEATYSRYPGAAAGQDLTYGYANGKGVASNSDLMIVLLDLDTGINLSHAKNPQHQAFYSPAQTTVTKGPGFSSEDYQLRDPWSHPYVITLDLNGDGNCEDALYGRQRKPVVIWSLGPDGKAGPANEDKKDNILGWQ